MDDKANTSGEEARPRVHRLTAVLAAAGLVGPTLFTLVFLALGLAHSDYSHVALPVSALATWKGGWVQSVNFIVFGALMIGFALGLHLGIRQARAGALGPALLGISGVGLIVAGLFPWQSADGAFVVPAGHLAGAFLTFVGAGAGLVAISRRMARDPNWQRVANYALGSGIAIVTLFMVIGALARAPGAPLHPWLGLLQRATLAVWFPCTIVLAWRLNGVARRRPAAAA